MFGNQQNKPRIKKSDPEVPALPDLRGSVTANKAEDFAETKTAELPKAIEKELEDVSDDVMEPKESEDITSESGEPTTDELLEDFPPETVEALKELENAKNDKEEKSSEEINNNASEKSSEENKEGEENSVQRTDNDEDMLEVLPEEWYNNPALALQLYRAYQKLPNYDLPYYGRRRRSPLKARMFTNDMKRSHRNKRDLPYSDEEYPMAYYPSEFGPSFTLKDLEAFAREKEYEDSVLRTILDNVGPDDVQEIEHQGVRGLFIPLEQEEVPVAPPSKRSSYFYPYSEEPETHFGAFVPEKKEYLDTYSRLVQLARELSKSDSDKEDYQRWQ